MPNSSSETPASDPIRAALETYLAGEGEAALARAYLLGRELLSDGVGLVELAARHGEAVDAILRARPAEAGAIVRDAAAFLVELLSPFEMTLRGYEEANAELRQLNLALESNMQELARAEAAAADANRAKTEFLARMSHELRTPLNAILGFGQILELDPLDDAQADSVVRILAAGRHLLTLIDESLDISRIETGRLALSMEPVAVPEVVAESITLLSPLAGHRRVTMSVDLDAYDGHVAADRQRVKQVLLNLISNGIKYNREGGTLTVQSSAQAAGRVRLMVKDTGGGIEPEKLSRVFSPFDRLGAEGSTVEGTGLGLAICKHLVEAMGGTIGLASTPAVGSTFWIELDASEPPAEIPLEAAVGPGSLELLQPRTILYVEDNLANLTLVERLLSRRGSHRVLPAMQGRLGIELARDHHPDLILLDLHLPDIPGEEVLAELQGHPDTRGIPVVVITADVMSALGPELVEAGARAYLSKPIDVREFLRLIEDLLAS